MTVLFLIAFEGLCSMKVLKTHALLSMNSSGNVRCKKVMLLVDLFIWFSIRFGKTGQRNENSGQFFNTRKTCPCNLYPLNPTFIY